MVGSPIQAGSGLISGGTITGNLTVTGTLTVQGTTTTTVNQTVSGTVAITAQSATALTVARTGTTYALQVDTNTALSVTGWKMTAAAAGSGAALAVISSGTNEAGTIDAKGSSALTINGTGTGNVVLATGGGNVGIGMTSPASILNVQQAISSGGTRGVVVDMYSATASVDGALIFQRSKNATGGLHTIVANGDAIGLIIGRGSNGTSFDNVAGIEFQVDGVPGTSNDMPGRILFYTTPDNSAGLLERVRIDNAGNVGIGTTSPVAGGGLTIAPAALTSGSPALLTVTGPAHTTLAASTEATDVNLNLARTVQFATGALTTQRAFLVQAPTYGFVAASTITNAATVAISGAPVAGTNATITNAYALWIQGGRVRGDGGLLIGAEPAGISGTVGYSNTVDNSANSTGVGTIKFKGTTSRDSSGFLKILDGTTARFIPYFDAITG